MAAADGMPELTNEVRAMRQEIADLKQQLQTAQRARKVVRDPFFSAALKRAHPMYVVKISTLLAPSFQHLRPHEELKAAGMLVEWQEGMDDVIFCSHTWLRGSHPDSEAGDKFALLTSLLRKIKAGKLDVYPEPGASFIFKATTLRLKAKDLKRSLADGYVFFDYMSIPQKDPEAQQRAVISLASYVSLSAYFFVLAGPWRHERTAQSATTLRGRSVDGAEWSLLQTCSHQRRSQWYSPGQSRPSSRIRLEVR